jgi:hypothetical protein
VAHGDPVVSPFVYDSGYDSNDRHIHIAINYDNTTRALLSANVHRDAGCQWTHVTIGIGPDGTPNTSTHQFDLSGVEGDIVVSAAQILQASGLSTIDEINALGNVTAY